jgi:hypothetical protein
MSNPLFALARKAAGIGPVNITPKQKYLALGVAAIVDVVQMSVASGVTIEGAMSPVEWAIDIGTALVLVLILGWNWRLALAFGLELVPGVALFPSWTALVFTFAATSGGVPDVGDAALNPGVPVAPGGPLPLTPPTITPGLPASNAPPPVEAGKFPGVYQRRSR